MKKKLFIGLLVLAFVLPTVAQDFTNSIKIRPESTWWKMQRWYNDSAQRWAREVEDRLVGGSGLGAGMGTIYYVDNNSGSNSDNGLSWDEAFLTITYAMAASHANIATSPNYADRNIILVRGDDFDEDWTKLAQKTDIIGVGSDDGNKGPRILGNHVIEAAGSGCYMGCRFFNMTFLNQTAADHFTIPTGQNGIEWIYCRFESSGTLAAPSAIDVTACNDTKIIGCDFISSTNKWASGAIDFGAGVAQNTQILGNYIVADIGITIDSATTGDSSRIEGNTIQATTLTVDDNSDVFVVADNRLITDGRRYQSIDFNTELAAGNVLTHSAGTVKIPYDNSCAGAIAAMGRGAHGKIFYCDANHGSNSNDGLSWEQPFLNMATALAAADTHVSSGGYACERCTVYYTGDEETVNQTKLAEKTDLVGVALTSAKPRTTIIGTWAIPATTNYMGFRAYNMNFKDDGAGQTLFHADTQNGIQFHNCAFQCDATGAVGLKLTECFQDVVIDNCKFTKGTSGDMWSTAAIQVDNDDDPGWDLVISNNLIVAEGKGIDWNETANTSCWILDNTIMCSTGMGIDTADATGVFVAGNRILTYGLAVADGTSNDFNILWAANNHCTGNNSTLYIPTYTDD